MTFKPIQFTYEEVRQIVQAFQMRILRLEGSKDYPEKGRDQVIQDKLLDWLYVAEGNINLATRGPKEGD